MTNDELAVLILPWAKEHHPDKYQQTLAVAGQGKTFRRYLIRLVEIRWATETQEWRRSVPLSVLEESGLTARFTHRPTGRTLEVKGKLAGARTWSFAELERLTDAPEELEKLAMVKEVFDLEHA